MEKQTEQPRWTNESIKYSALCVCVWIWMKRNTLCFERSWLSLSTLFSFSLFAFICRWVMFYNFNNFLCAKLYFFVSTTLLLWRARSRSHSPSDFPTVIFILFFVISSPFPPSHFFVYILFIFFSSFALHLQPSDPIVRRVPSYFISMLKEVCDMIYERRIAVDK